MNSIKFISARVALVACLFVGVFACPATAQEKFVNIYQARDPDFQKATQRIYRSGQTDSHLKLTVLP